VLLDIEHIGTVVGIVLLSCVHWDRYMLILIYFRFQDTIFEYSLNRRRPVLTFVPLCCLQQKICGFRWNFTYNPSAMSGLSVSGLTSAILVAGWTLIELCTGWCCYQQRWRWHPQNKRSNAKLSSKGDVRPLIQWSPSLSQKIIHPPSLPVT